MSILVLAAATRPSQHLVSEAGRGGGRGGGGGGAPYGSPHTRDNSFKRSCAKKLPSSGPRQQKYQLLPGTAFILKQSPRFRPEMLGTKPAAPKMAHTPPPPSTIFKGGLPLTSAPMHWNHALTDAPQTLTYNKQHTRAKGGQVELVSGCGVRTHRVSGAS